MDALRNTFAQETGKLVGFSLPNLPDEAGQVYSARQDILSTHSTVV